jgi:hypothetical protein
MVTNESISLLQILTLCFTNSLGLIIFVLIYLIMRKEPKNINEKLIISVKVSLISQGILLTAFMDAGIYFWINTGNISSFLSVLPLTLCVGPIIIPITIIGVYVQYSYREKIQDVILSTIRKKSS